MLSSIPAPKNKVLAVPSFDSLSYHVLSCHVQHSFLLIFITAWQQKSFFCSSESTGSPRSGTVIRYNHMPSSWAVPANPHTWLLCWLTVTLELLVPIFCRYEVRTFLKIESTWRKAGVSNGIRRIPVGSQSQLFIPEGILFLELVFCHWKLESPDDCTPSH